MPILISPIHWRSSRSSFPKTNNPHQLSLQTLNTTNRFTAGLSFSKTPLLLTQGGITSKNSSGSSSTKLINKKRKEKAPSPGKIKSPYKTSTTKSAKTISFSLKCWGKAVSEKFILLKK